MRHHDDSALVVKLLDLRTDLLKLIQKTVAYDRTSIKSGSEATCPCRDHSLELLKKKLLAAEKDL